MSGHRFDEDLTEDLTVAQIAIRVDTAFAMTAVIAVGIFIVILFIAGTG